MIPASLFRGFAQHQGRFASSADFRALFEKEAPSLFQLAYLLTAEPDLAEQVFSSALDDCLGAASVSREWASKWARRSVIRRAIQTLRERNASAISNSIGAGPESKSDPTSVLRRIVSLSEFERLVYVLSVLEGYSKAETAILLGKLVGDVLQARTQALLRVDSPLVQNSVASLS